MIRVKVNAINREMIIKDTQDEKGKLIFIPVQSDTVKMAPVYDLEKRICGNIEIRNINGDDFKLGKEYDLEFHEVT